MFERILFPTDFSDYAEVSLSCLGELSRAGAVEIVLLHVIDPYHVAGVSGSGDIEALQRGFQEEAEEALEKVRKNLEDQGFTARTLTPVPVGDAAEEIVKAAEKEAASLIFIGSRGRGILREALLGSVSSKVVKTAEVPVLVTKARVLKEMGTVKCEKACEFMFRKILYATDFSECSQRTLEYLKEAIKAGVGVTGVILVHVVEKWEVHDDIEKTRRKAEEGLDAIKKEIRELGVEAEIRLLEGIPSQEILKAAQEGGASIIMMGSRGMGFVEGMLLGSTSNTVVREAEVPVFLCKRKIEVNCDPGADDCCG